MKRLGDEHYLRRGRFACEDASTRERSGLSKYAQRHSCEGVSDGAIIQPTQFLLTGRPRKLGPCSINRRRSEPCHGRH